MEAVRDFVATRMKASYSTEFKDSEGESSTKKFTRFMDEMIGAKKQAIKNAARAADMAD